MPSISIAVDPVALLSRSPGRAYAFAVQAAEQDDAEAVRAFLRAGVDPVNGKHLSVVRGGADEVNCVWHSAVRAGATRAMDSILEGRSPKETARLMKARPEGKSALHFAMWENIETSIAFFIERAVPMDPCDAVQFYDGAPNWIAAALTGHEELVAHFCADRSRAKRSTAAFSSRSYGPTHALAAGDCASLISEMAARDPESLRAKSSHFPLVEAHGRAAHWRRFPLSFLEPDDLPGLSRFRAEELPARLKGGFDALDWALLSRAPRALRALRSVFGGEAPAERAREWRTIFGMALRSPTYMHGRGFASVSPEQAEAEHALLLSFLETVELHGALGVAANAGANAPVAARAPSRL
jgi:hypothetical protein